MQRPALIATAALILASASPSAVIAQDASFGCEVLLCAAATAPGWAGIPYCVPVMQQLFLTLALRAPWPTCPEANVSNQGYEPYESCPTGLSAAQRSTDGSLAASPNGDLCADLTQAQTNCGTAGSACVANATAIARIKRSDPYYVDISTTNGVQRFYYAKQGE